MIVVGLTGKAGAGKDVVADYLVEKYGFQKRAFATSLKSVLFKQNPIIGMDIMQPGRVIHLNEAIEKYGEPGVKSIYPQYRRYMQRLGTEGIRAIDPDFWINALLKSLDEETGKYVITDIRFPNEAHAVGNLRGSLWEIVRPSYEEKGASHSSESWAGKLGEEFFIYNNGSLDKLYSEADYALGLLNWRTVAAA